MLAALSDWNAWWETGAVNPVLRGEKRHTTPDFADLLDFREVKTLTGIRRSGKSTLMYQFIDRLLRKERVSPDRILLVNFEDPTLSQYPLEKIFDEYRRHINLEDSPYLFLDEVHRCPEWVLLVRKLHDLRQAEQIFITDSSSRFVKREYSDTLTGRSVNIRVFPLSFQEFLGWKDVEPSPAPGRKKKNEILSHLDEYLQWGGMPEVVSKQVPAQKKVLLSNYLDDIVHKDIVERHRADYARVRDFVEYLTSNSGSLFSPRNFSRTRGLSLDSINTYLGYMKEVYLVHTAPLFDHSVRRQQINPKKIFICDTGFFHKLGFHSMDNRGPLLENAVFLELIRRSEEVFYWKGERECDFVLREGIRPKEAIQVCYELTTENEVREKDGLYEAMKTLELKEGTLITDSQEGVEKHDGMTVNIVPLWKFLLRV